MGQALPGDRGRLAQGMAACHPVFRVRAFDPQNYLYTTNTVEAVNRSLRKIIKTRGSFPTDEAAFKLLYLALKNAGAHWKRPIEWTAAMGQFAIQFGDRFASSAR
jgi:putative transposase